MLTLQVFIENQQLELFKDESVTFTQTIQEVRDIQKIFTDYTRTFSIPATKNNNKIFKHFYNPNIVGFDARTKKDAELYLNNKLFKKGRIKLEGTTKRDNKPHTYKITFFGSTVKITDLIGEDKISSLRYLRDHYTFDYTNANIVSYMADGLDITANGVTITDAIIFPLITHTKRLIYDSTTDSTYINSDTLNNIAYNASHATPLNYGLQLNQLKPAIRIYAIIKAIELEYGFTFSDDFFSQYNENFYSLYMWLHNKTGDIFEEGEDIAFATNFQASDRSFDGNIILSNSTFDISGNRTGIFVGNRDIDRQLNITVIPPSNDAFDLIIYKDGKLFKRYDGVDRTENGITWSIEQVEGDHLNLGKEGGVFSIGIQSDSAGTYDIRGDVKVKRRFATDNDKWTGQAVVGSDQTINVTTQLPDIKVMDFLTGLFKMFNLTATLDNDNVITVKTLDQFYAESTNTWDITKDLDKDSTTVDSVLPYNYISFGYEGLDNFFAAQHKELFFKEWGTEEHNMSRKYEGQPYEIKLPFEHLKFEKLIDVNDNSEEDIQWGWSADIKQDPNLGKPILFYAIPKAVDIYRINLNGSGQRYQGDIYLPSNSIRFSDSFNINFAAELNEFDPNRLSYEKTLFNTYYRKYVDQMFEQTRRLTTIQAYLPLSMLMNYSLADSIRIFDQLYRINKVTTNFETMKSTLELINIRDQINAEVNESAGTIIPEKTELVIDGLIPDKFKNNASCITADNTEVFADNFKLKADADCNLEGEEVKNVAEVIPLQVEPTNQPQTIDVNKGVEVTPGVIELSNVGFRNKSEVGFSASVDKLGRLGRAGIGHWSEYGVFWGTDFNDLIANDINVLQSKTSLTHISVKSTELNRYKLPRSFTFQTKNLSANTKYYYKAYIITNLDPNYPTETTAFTRVGFRQTLR
jgi:hypothetical protein